MPSRKPSEKPLTVWDRTVYGAIASVFGVLLGLGACLCLAFAFEASVPVRSIVLASAIYFFIIGMLRGADAAFFAGEALSAVGAAALVETGAIPCDGADMRSRWNSWSSPVLLVVWIAMIVVLAWRN